MFNLSSNIPYLSKETKLKLIFELLFLFLSKSIRKGYVSLFTKYRAKLCICGKLQQVTTPRSNKKCMSYGFTSSFLPLNLSVLWNTWTYLT